ncbi:MAG TPA: bifunctional 5,10-methylenetetrahydrofolate dehydrogenase/5,10-methenyltetrahydrofolate cyclohydrolase [Candidatus Saccharimonadia bacterium]
MKLLSGRDIALFIKERHALTVAGLSVPPKLAIIRSADNEAAERYLRAKSAYGHDIGAQVDTYVESAGTMLDRIAALNADPSVTGIIIQLPVTTPELTDAALAAVAPAKDVDGLGPNSPYEAGTPKAVLWLLAAHNVDIAGRIAVVGQGRLIGRPLADRLEAAGHHVTRCDIHTPDVGAVTRASHMVFSATGQPHLIKSQMIMPGTVCVDAGSPAPEFDPAVYQRDDVIITPNPGGVGPMTVVSLFDNLLIAAQQAAAQPRR